MGKQANGGVDEARAVDHLLDLLRIEGLSGREGRVAEAVIEKLIHAGCKPRWMKHDDAHSRIARQGLDFEIGNLIVKLPGTTRAPRRLFAGHLDTVPLCRGGVPVRKATRIVARGKTALGADSANEDASCAASTDSPIRRSPCCSPWRKRSGCAGRGW